MPQTASDQPEHDGQDHLSMVLPQVYDELRQIAASYLSNERVGHTLQPTALVHEAFLKLADQTGVHWNDQTHFCALAARAMRQILVDHARRKNSNKRGGEWLRISFTDAANQVTEPEVDVLALDEALIGLAELDERKSQVVELRFFGGLTCEQAAQMLSISPKTAEADWYFARAWLRSHLSKTI